MLIAMFGMLAAGLFSLMLIREKQYRPASTGRHFPTALMMEKAPQGNLIPTTIPKSVPVVKVPILMYHYVEIVRDPKDTIRRGLDILPTTFDAQIATLVSHGYTTLFMNDLADYFNGKLKLPDKPIILTFDDGYRDFYTDAFPVLQKYHVKATSYVVPGFLGGPNYMTKDQVKAIAESGIVEVAAHTIHHVNLKNAPQHVLENEISGSKIQLEQLIGKPVTDFAYPYGLYDNASVVAVAAAGFATAVTTRPGELEGKDYRYTLTRLRPGGRVGDVLITWLNSIKN